MGWPLLAAPLLLILLWRQREIAWPRLEGGASGELFRRQLGPSWTGLVTATGVVVVLLSVALPLGQLLGARRTWIELFPSLQAGLEVAWNSAWYAVATATITVGLASWIIARWTRRGAILAPALASLLWIPFFIPGLFLGLALIALFNRPGLDVIYQGSGIVLIAFVLRYLALGWFGALLAWRGVDRDLVDAGRMCGASGWPLWRQIIWPQLRSQLGAAWLVVYLLCLWDVETLVLILPPGGETLALRVFNLLHYGHNAQVNALCLWLLALAVLPLLLWWIGSQLRRVTFLPSAICHLPFLPALCGILLTTGCTPPKTELHSQIFGAVEIIGTRGAGPGQFNKPRSVAVDADDNLYVVDMTGRVQKFTPDGRFVLAWQMPQTDLGKPKGMNRDREGRIIVLEPHYSRVNLFSANGLLAAQWGRKGTNAGLLTVPRAVVVSSRGEFWISEYSDAERVQRFTAQGQFLQELGRPGSAPGEFNRPEGLGVDAQDRLYVADSCNHRVQIFGPDGHFLRTHGHAGSGPGEFSYPYDVRVDELGRQYVCEFGNSRLQVFDAQDHLLEILGGPGFVPGRFSNPWSLAFDSKGNLYVADSQNHRVQKLVRRPGKNDQSRMTNDQRMTNLKFPIARGNSNLRHSILDIHSSFVIRHSSFPPSGA